MLLLLLYERERGESNLLAISAEPGPRALLSHEMEDSTAPHMKHRPLAD